MEKVDVVYGESRGRLRRKCRSLTEEVGMVVVNRESGDRLERKWELWSLKENWWLQVVVNGESGCHLWRK